MGATAISGEEPAMLLRPVVRNGRPGLIGRMAGATVVVGLSRRQQAEAQQAAAGQPAVGADPIAQLRELAALKEQGVLTEEEFTAQKARLLGHHTGA
jgi:Short C-terminal domain